MTRTDLLIDLGTVDMGRVLADSAAIERVNPQRFEFSQLSAVVLDDDARNLVVGYKDVADDEFWARGHMPGMPFLPGALICESAAQLCSYHAHMHDLTGGNTLGLGGLDRVRFRKLVFAPCRLIVAAQVSRMRRGVTVVYQFQSFVAGEVVCEGVIRGICLPTLAPQSPALGFA